jgi:hypothetical protein
MKGPESAGRSRRLLVLQRKEVVQRLHYGDCRTYVRVANGKRACGYAAGRSDRLSEPTELGRSASLPLERSGQARWHALRSQSQEACHC